MPNLTATQWLQAGLILILLVLLALYTAKQWQRARQTRNNYRTANGREIDAQSKAILHTPMAVAYGSRRLRAGQVAGLHIVPTPHSMPSELHQVRAQRRHEHAASANGYGENNQASVRGTAAALYDMGHGGKRRAGPYTIGSTQHADWLKAYEAAYIPKPATVQTSAQSAEEPAAA